MKIEAAVFEPADPGARGSPSSGRPRGLSAGMAARLTRWFQIIAVDAEPRRLDLARQVGATQVLKDRGHRLAGEIVERSGGEVDYAVEATDGSNLVATACEALAIHGVCAMVGGQP